MIRCAHPSGRPTGVQRAFRFCPAFAGMTDLIRCSLINTERNKVNDVVEALSNIDGITEIYSVAGEHDLVVIIRAQDNEAMADAVTNMGSVTNDNQNQLSPTPFSQDF